MNIDAGDIVGLIAGVKGGQIAEREAKALLRSWGMDDDLLTGLLAAGVGLAFGAATGSVVNDVVDGLLGGLFD